MFTDVKILTCDHTTPHRYADLPLKCNGTFQYYFYIYTLREHIRQTCCDDYFIVSGVKLLLSGICCITHSTKLLGPLTDWEGQLRVSYEAAYNMIHLTPIQQLGSSQSAYSINISDHLALCDRYLPADYKPQDISVTYTGMSWLHILYLLSIKSALKLWSVVTSVGYTGCYIINC